MRIRIRQPGILLCTLALLAVLGGPLATPAYAKRERGGHEPQQQEERTDSHERGQRNENPGRHRDHEGHSEERIREEHGRDERGADEGRDAQRSTRKGVLGRDAAVRHAQRQYGGRVLSVDLLQPDDGPARYRIKLLSDGNVRSVDVDALEE